MRHYLFRVQLSISGQDIIDFKSNNQMLDLVQEIQSYSPQTNNSKPSNSFSQDPHLAKPNPYLIQNPPPNANQIPPQPEPEEKEQGLTRFCKQKYYEEYFRVNQQNVKDRIKAAMVPPYSGQFLEQIKPNPDFYGPFWIFTTLVLLLGIVGNFANYILSKFSDGKVWQGYFFKLQLVRYAVTMVFSFGAGVPLILFFMFKFMKCNLLSFPEISCLYGYAMTCYIPALAVCIIPLQTLQWVLMLYAFANSSLFLFVNLRQHIEGGRPKLLTVMVTLMCLQLVFFLVCKLVFISLMGVDASDKVPLEPANKTPQNPT